METRASYLLVGAFVLVLAAGLAGFIAGLVGGVADEDVALYDVVFTSSVTGLQEGGQVRYRGVPVGTVRDIRIDPRDIGRVIVTAAIEDRAPIREQTVASLEMLGITGIAYVQLSEAPEGSPPLTPEPGRERPVIPAVPSALEQVFESTPELLAQGVQVMTRLAEALDQIDLEALGGTLENVEAITGALAGRADGIGRLLDEGTKAATSVDAAATDVARLTQDLRALLDSFGGRGEVVADEATETMQRVQTAAAQLGDAAAQLEAVVGDVRQPLDDFADTGLYNFSQLIGETRVLIAALNRISKEFERNPTGFLLGTNQRGFEAQ